MTEFTESGILFQFDKNWVVQKYDEHRYFRRLCSVGLKGMDFLGIYGKEELILLEIKNYRIRYTEKPPTAIYHILQHPEILADKIIGKTRDTLQTVRVVNKYYRRNFFYRLFLPLLLRMRASRRTLHTRLFWTQAQVLAESENIRVILWLETETEYEIFSKEEVKDFRNKVQTLLDKNGDGIRFEICNAGSKVPGISAAVLPVRS